MSKDEKCNGYCRSNLLRIEWCPECIKEAHRIAVSKPPPLHSKKQSPKRDWGGAVSLTRKQWMAVADWVRSSELNVANATDDFIVKFISEQQGGEFPIAKKRMTPEVIRESLKVR